MINHFSAELFYGFAVSKESQILFGEIYEWTVQFHSPSIDLGYGVFPEVSWHKTANEDILRNSGFKIEYGEMLEEGILKGTYKTVSDREHVEIIRMYIEEGLSMIEIAAKLHRSSRTPKLHVDSHNASIKRSGF